MALTPRKINAEDSYKPIDAASASTKALARGAYGFTTIESSATPTLGLEHNQQRLVLTASSPTLTIPTQASVAFPTNFAVTIFAVSGCTIVGDTGVTINEGDTVIVSGTPAVADLVRTASNTWEAHVGNASTGTGISEATLLATLQAASADTDMADAILDVIVAGTSTKIVAMLNAVAAITATTRAAALGRLHIGADDDGPGNPGETWITDAFGNLTGKGYGGNDLAEALDRTPGQMPFDPELLGAFLAKGSDIASASTLTVDEGLWFHVTGTTTITDIDFSFDGASGGRAVILLFDGACQVTHNASTLVVAGGNNWTSTANDAAIVVSNGSDKVYFYPIGGTGGGGLDEWTAASASGPSTLDFFEDTDNGSNRVRLTAPASISSDATMTLPALSETVKATGAEMEWIPAASMTPRPTSGAEPVTVELSGQKVVFDALAFDTSADEFAQWTWRPPKRWNVGTLTFIPIWAHPSTTTNFSVLWGIQALARSNDDAGDTAFGTAVTSQGEGGTTSDIYMGATTSACTASGTPAAADLLFFQIYRDVDGNGTSTNDDLAVDAYLLGVVMIWTSSAANDA